MLTTLNPSTTKTTTSNCPTQTFGGNANGSPYYFPFIYQGVPYTQCITLNAQQLWCATSPSYDADKMWGYCGGKMPHHHQAH